MVNKTVRKTVRKTKRPVVRTARVYSNDYNNVDHMAAAVRGVLKSLTDKDGYYDIKEADTIGNIFGKQVSLLKAKLEAHKAAKGDVEIERKLLSQSFEEE